MSNPRVLRSCHRVHVVATHICFHAACAFLEYHITDVAFHILTGTDATTFIMHVVLHILV